MTEEEKDREYTLQDVRKEVEENAEAEKDKGEKVQLVVFRVGDEAYGLPIDQVKEVVHTPRMAKMPRTPDHLKGVANIRGRILPIMDLKEKFGLSDGTGEEDEGGDYTLVIEGEEISIGVLVREVPNTMTVYSADIDDSSSLVQYSSVEEDCIKGVANTEDKMVILLDMLEMMRSEEVKKVDKAIKE